MTHLTAIIRSARGPFLARESASAHNFRAGEDKCLAGFDVGCGTLNPLLVRRVLETDLSAGCVTHGQQAVLADGHLSEADMRAPVERLLRALAVMTSAKAVTLRMRSSAGDSMQLVAAGNIGIEQQDRIAVVEGGCGVCCNAVRDGAIRKAKQTCHCVRELSKHSGKEQMVVAVPLRNRGEVSGVLSLFMEDSVEKSGLLAGAMDMLPALGEVLALVLEKAILSEAEFHAGLMLQRQLIANEVHDSLAQNLASIRMRTALLRDAVAKRDATRTTNYLAEIDESLGLAQSRVREIITDFRSQMGATQLVPALESAIDELRAASGIQIDFDSGVHEPRLSAFEQVQVFYIAREALTNALKHAKASVVRVALAEVNEHVELLVEDDGVGLDRFRSTDNGHFGLNIMSERASRIGGSVEFEIGAKGGTCVRLRFPSRIIGGEATA